MSKFNTTDVKAPAPKGAVQSEVTHKASTYNGGAGAERTKKSELFLLAVTNMVGEDTFYEGKDERDERFRSLVRTVAVKDPEWTLRFVTWLRAEANMRSASVVAAVEAGDAIRATKTETAVGARAFLKNALQRADEPGEALAYAKSRGIALSGGIQRGIADAATRLYNERNLLKYDGQSKGFRFGDVLELTHAKPAAPWQGPLFKYAIDRRHNRDDIVIPESCSVLRARATLEATPVAQRRALLGDPNLLGLAGMTWESVSGWLQGPMDKQAWEAIIPSMGYMALLRNLRNFDQAGVSDEVAARVTAKLSNPEEVAKSRQFPMRFLSAYNAAPSLRWSYPLEQALQHSLKNVPVLKGRTLILIDTSGSMRSPFSRDGSLKFWEAAALFGVALASQAENVTVVSYSTDSKEFPLVKGESVLKGLERFRSSYFYGGGTATAQAVQRHFSQHDRVVILTDEQADAWGWSSGYYNERAVRAVSDTVPTTTPLYTFNLAGYKYGHGESGADNRYTFGGLSDSGFKMLALLERGKNADWPF